MREKDGLAMSSRNMRLSAKQRNTAPVLYQTLQQARVWCLQMPIAEVKQAVEERLSAINELQLEYFEVVNSQTLEAVDQVHPQEQLSLCIAAYMGEVRLIDNVFLYEH
jgi:pantoate--beta-alanine ligase